MTKRSGFTLVELMIIVAILSDVMIIAMPAFIRARNLSQNTKYISDLRTASAAFEMYAAENDKYPAGAGLGIIPTGMGIYLRGVDWTDYTPISGRWQWVYSASAIPQIQVNFTRAPDPVRMADIDTRIDNGTLATGQFRQLTSTSYTYLLE